MLVLVEGLLALWPYDEPPVLGLVRWDRRDSDLLTLEPAASVTLAEVWLTALLSRRWAFNDLPLSPSAGTPLKGRLNPVA